MQVEVSNGELLDKFSILVIKENMIRSQESLVDVRNEHRALEPNARRLLNAPGAQILFDKLVEVNEQIWILMEKISDLRESKGPEYLRAVEETIDLNMLRALIKREINVQTGSLLREAKSYFGDEPR